MTPESLYEQLHLEGFTLRAEDDRLLVAPADRLTPEQREAIFTNKMGLLDLVRSGFDPGRQRRIDQALASYEPDFTSGPVQLVNLILVDVFGRLVAVDPKQLELVAEYNRGVYERERAKHHHAPSDGDSDTPPVDEKAVDRDLLEEV